MKPIYIVGAGGAAKEIHLLIKEINLIKPVFDFKGFVDVCSEKHITIGKYKYDIIEESTFLKNHENVCVIFGLGDASKLKKIAESYKETKKFEFPNIIHPNVNLDESVNLGVGNIITTLCVFTVDTVVGSFNYFNRGNQIGHDCSIGSYNVINPVISGGVIIEDENLIGTNSTILQYIKIGSKNTVGAGAVVTKNVENNRCMIGVPAKQKI